MTNATQVADVSGPIATTAGTGITIASWLATWDWGFLIGVGIGVAGLLISFLNYLSNRQFQKRKDQREEALHQLEMKKLEGLCDVEK